MILKGKFPIIKMQIIVEKIKNEQMICIQKIIKEMEKHEYKYESENNDMNMKIIGMDICIVGIVKDEID